MKGLLAKTQSAEHTDLKSKKVRTEANAQQPSLI